MDRNQIICLFSPPIRERLSRLAIDFSNLYEIRLRIQGPLLLVYKGEEFFLGNDGKLCREERQAYYVSARDIQESLEHIAGYSLYAYEDEVRQGFLTVQGGHRVGIAGKTILDGDKVKGVKHISYMNVRLAHQVTGCADFVMPYLYQDNRVCHTLIISPPRCGKTTLLRDVIRQISNGFGAHPGQTVGVVDERSESAGCYQGIPQNDLGIRTDVLDCCPKAEGMMMLIRSMSPSVVAVDEIGDYEDIRAIESVIHCGCTLMSTVHGGSIDEIKQKPLLQRLMDERVFERYILLAKQKRAGVVQAIFDERGTCLYQEKACLC